MRNYHISKTLAVGIVILFVGTSIIPAQSSISLNEEPVHIPNSSGKTIYVDDDNTEGPWDGTIEHPYQFIQDGIDVANEGDTVYVFNGVYHNKEDSIVNLIKPILLIGENKETTIIDAQKSGDKVWINNGAIFSGFTVHNASSHESDEGISCGFNSKIHDNIIKLNGYGICIYGSNNTISKNEIIDNVNGIIYMSDFAPMENNTISYNIIRNNEWGGIASSGEGYNEISHNIIEYNGVAGVSICWGKNNYNEIFLNSFNNNKWSIMLWECHNNKIFKNNFYGKTRIFKMIHKRQPDSWYNNYWGQARLIPKIIIGWSFAGWIQPPDDEWGMPGIPFYYPWTMWDWLPAQKPFDIDKVKILEELK